MVGRAPEPSTQEGGEAAAQSDRGQPWGALQALLDRAAAWRRLEPEEIAADLADALLSICEATAVLVRLGEGDAAVDLVRPDASAASALAALSDSTAGEPVAIDLPSDGGAATARAVRVPSAGEIEVVAASARAEFPSPRDLLLMRVACEQASLAALAGRLRGDIRRAEVRRDEFLTAFGHELRDHLAPILTAVALLKMNGGTGQEHERERHIISRQSTLLAHLVGDLLDLAHLSRGRLRIRREPVELAGAVASALEEMQALAGERLPPIDADVSPGIYLQADRTRLVQVLSILLLRAVRCSEPGERISVEGRRSGEEVVIRVRDSGAIQSDRVPHVFDPFAPPARPNQPRQGGFGLGLGLALARGLVVLHGGSVSLSSGPGGRGTEIIVRLPAIGEARPPAERSVTPPRVAGPDITSGLQVLVVDDNIDQADSLAMFIEASGIKAQVAYSPMQALHMAQSQKFAVAVLDIGLPGMDGYELARRLRRTRHGAEMRLLALTGFGDEQDLTRSRQVGFRKHFVKPIDGATLLAAIVQEALRGPRGVA